MGASSSFFADRRSFMTGSAAVIGGLVWPVTPAWSGEHARASIAGHEAVATPMLANVYSRQVDPALCLVSEKYDGVRAVWDGRVLRHRSGRVVSAPASFLQALPVEPLDGELWLGRGRFDAVSATVRRAVPQDDEWAAVRYMVFEQPGGSGSFADRYTGLQRIVARVASPRIVLAPQERVADEATLQRRLASVVAAGGEGLVLHVASASAVQGRSDLVLKLKPHLDAEATVVGHRMGRGKYRDEVGALDVVAPDGRRFRVGSGLSDALRRDPPAPGTVITYRYRDLTATGLPRFATYLRRHDAI